MDKHRFKNMKFWRRNKAQKASKGLECTWMSVIEVSRGWGDVRDQVLTCDILVNRSFEKLRHSNSTDSTKTQQGTADAIWWLVLIIIFIICTGCWWSRKLLECYLWSTIPPCLVWSIAFGDTYHSLNYHVSLHEFTVDPGMKQKVKMKTKERKMRKWKEGGGYNAWPVEIRKEAGLWDSGQGKNKNDWKL